jgi:hypothetical protein
MFEWNGTKNQSIFISFASLLHPSSDRISYLNWFFFRRRNGEKEQKIDAHAKQRRVWHDPNLACARGIKRDSMQVLA